MNIISASITSEKTANNVAFLARRYCLELGFERSKINLVFLAVSEIAFNVVKYGIKGTCVISSIDNNAGIRIEISDEGKGIENIDQALQDGFTTTPTSLGVGLGASNRAMDYFDIKNSKNIGITVVMEKWLSQSKIKLDYSGLSMQRKPNQYGFEQYLFKEIDGNSLLALSISGLGDGTLTKNILNYVELSLTNTKNIDISKIASRCNLELKKYYNLPEHSAISIIKTMMNKVSIVCIGKVSFNIFSGDELIHNQNSKNLKDRTFMYEYELGIDSIVIVGTGCYNNDIMIKNTEFKCSARSIVESICSQNVNIETDANILVIKQLK